MTWRSTATIPLDLSNMGYSDFLTAYREIIGAACKKLKENRFAVFVVGEIRDKQGAYRDFVGDTKAAFMDSGLKFYNEAILINQYGTAPMRARNVFEPARKLVKVHQNVLVFYKGDLKKIRSEFDNNFRWADLEQLKG